LNPHTPVETLQRLTKSEFTPVRERAQEALDAREEPA